MLNQKDFFKKYTTVSEDDLKTTGLEWSELEAIYNKHISKMPELTVNGNLIVEYLRQIKQVHSLRFRIKDPEHLIEKIIRKKKKEPNRCITLDNYDSEITDLIGIRALHLYKVDWICIHKEITRRWRLLEKPIIYIREGDKKDLFKPTKCKVVEHERGYRSVHYLVKSQPTKDFFIAEVQVRTIFEEGWSEIDHDITYPYQVDNVILSEYLNVFNRLAGNADEMGTYIKSLNSQLEHKEKSYKELIIKSNIERAQIAKSIESLTKELSNVYIDNSKIQHEVNNLSSLINKQLSINNQLTSLDHFLSGFDWNQFDDSETILIECSNCGQIYDNIIGEQLISIDKDEWASIEYQCPKCGTANKESLKANKQI